MSKKKVEFIAVPAYFHSRGRPADPSEWIFCLKDPNDGDENRRYVWAFPGWLNEIHKKPYHYMGGCSRRNPTGRCRHKPPEVYIKFWKCLFNLRKGLDV